MTTNAHHDASPIGAGGRRRRSATQPTTLTIERRPRPGPAGASLDAPSAAPTAHRPVGADRAADARRRRATRGDRRADRRVVDGAARSTSPFVPSRVVTHVTPGSHRLTRKPAQLVRQNGAMPGESNVEVLIAEDDRAVRESLARALRARGLPGRPPCRTVRRRSTRCAWHAPDIILLDVSMPLVDGLTVCRVLRSEQNHVPVLMLTARTETSDRVAGLDAGADDYLPKPYDLDELLARVRALLRRADLRRRRRRVGRVHRRRPAHRHGRPPCVPRHP